jgi:lysozyme
MTGTQKKLLFFGSLILLYMVTKGSGKSALDSLINFLKGSEGIDLNAYQDTGGVWTIGYGETFNFDQNRPVQKGDKITIDTANRWLTNEANSTLDSVKQVVKVPLNNNQFAALSSFVYNIGLGAFKNSTMLKLINNKTDKNIIANQFDKWVYVNGQISKGLKNRRDKEKKLFLS